MCVLRWDLGEFAIFYRKRARGVAVGSDETHVMDTHNGEEDIAALKRDASQTCASGQIKMPGFKALVPTHTIKNHHIRWHILYRVISISFARSL